ncbi:hypothetical protein P154DRAFT_564936 [Amniculicola lignicola CBS 123094]|uniref:histone acetyltransferase n=1 Tax=Amniculicola lignicola CBS 123094 TaxID=1392246 RepID=A0A6A5W8C8_9PLEO|nr:hypothetical protein P154DRAFT_564936 [Amniculicola lignicola CBS 123094]
MAHIPTSKPLKDLFADALPRDVSFIFYHYSTPPSKSTPLFSAPPHRKSERTFCESHFLSASIIPKDGTKSSKIPEELLVLAIEVLVYTTKSLTTIFVSKADSTGYLTTLNLPRSQAGSPLKTICGIFVSWLARERQRDGTKLVISLFARAQDQYLFPASIENKDKHVLDDRGLVKWWCKVLDPLVLEYAEEGAAKPFKDRLADRNDAGHAGPTPPKTDSTAKGYLVVPGFDVYDTLRYLPPAPSPDKPRRWAAAHPLREIAPHPGAPPRCLVPHFPDDPKARFLDELDDELPDRMSDDMTQMGGTPSRSNGQWKSIKTLEQFWETMAFRQECSSGRIVGFIWVVITPPRSTIPEEEEESSQSQSQSQTQKDSEESFPALPSLPKKKSEKASSKKPRRRKVNTTTGPIPLLLPKIKSSSSNLATMLNSTRAPSNLPPEATPYFRWPATSRGTLLFASKTYDRAHAVLLQQNFSSRAAAARSTKKWKEEMAVLGGMEEWGWIVVGKKEGTVGSQAQGVVNGVTPTTILGVRKKRKPEEGAAAADEQGSVNGETGPNVLGEGLVRKKVKAEGTTASGAANGVNTLGVGLVRKKPKA